MNERITINLGERSYDVLVGTGVLGRPQPQLTALLPRRHTAVVTDETVARLYLPILQRSLLDAGIVHEAIVLPTGEDTKSFAQLERLVDRLLAAKIERRDVVLALGGGVIGDLAGFAASIIRRGAGIIHLPTTLLAMVDSAIGGKTAINTPRGKNLIGIFHQPKLVLADVDTLATLPERELRAGYAEVVKYGLIDDPTFFAWLETHGRRILGGDAEARRQAVVTCARAKGRFVEADERELTGARALLNLGHTFAHAIETAVGYDGRILHGEAVAIGLTMAFDLSVAMKLCPAEAAERVRRHLHDAGLPTTLAAYPELKVAELLANIGQDKKTESGRTAFVLVRGIGQAFLHRDVGAGDLAALFEQALAA